MYDEPEMLRGSLKGNGMNTIGYDANGEASDWMLATHGILSFSPELGSSGKNKHHSDTFFIKDHDELHKVMK